MIKKTIMLAVTVLLMLSIFGCTKSEEPEEPKKAPKNAFTDYVDTGVNTMNKSRELVKDSKKLADEKDKMLENMDK